MVSQNFVKRPRVISNEVGSNFLRKLLKKNNYVD